MSAEMTAEEVASQLCLVCGLCCDGTLFKDVELQAKDHPQTLRDRGLALFRRRAKVRFPQPCTALNGCACRIYPDRPARCCDFECLLFRAVLEGVRTTPEARRIIRQARERADRVRRLLQWLGDTDETVALSVRFRRMQRRFENDGGDEESVDRYGELTLAVHDLNILLRDAFYR
jgi:hypothetical protein